MKISFDDIRELLGKNLSGLWGPDRYWIFQDPVYELVPIDIAQKLVAGAPQVAYVTDVYDCDDHALEFKAYVARTQKDSYPAYTRPFCVGFARGRFAWAAAGQIEHVANFVVCEDSRVYWTDLQIRNLRPLSDAGKGLAWLIL